MRQSVTTMLTVVLGVLSAPCASWAGFLESVPVDTAAAFGPDSADVLWPSLGRLTVTLLFVIALIWVTVWIARRVLRGGLARRETTVRVLDRAHLAPKRSIDIVSVGKRILVLGVTETSIGLLTELDPGDLPEADAKTAPGHPSRAPAQRERDLLNQARRRLNTLFRSAHLSTADPAPKS